MKTPPAAFYEEIALIWRTRQIFSDFWNRLEEPVTFGEAETKIVLFRWRWRRYMSFCCFKKLFLYFFLSPKRWFLLEFWFLTQLDVNAEEVFCLTQFTNIEPDDTIYWFIDPTTTRIEVEKNPDNWFHDVGLNKIIITRRWPRVRVF